MSRYCWEAGTLKIPSKEWVTFRNNLVKAWNDRQAELIEIALRAHARLAEDKAQAPRGKFEPRAAFFAAYSADKSQSPDARRLKELAGEEEVQRAVLKEVKDPVKGRAWALRTPKKTDFLPASATKIVRLEAGSDSSIELNHKDKTVSWSVSENNHAVRDERNSHMGRALFLLLGKVSWTRGSGGEIVGNDEYNRYSREAGGGANYVTAKYGPAKPSSGRVLRKPATTKR